MHPKAIALLICLGLYFPVIAQSGAQKNGPGYTALLADLSLYRSILEKRPMQACISTIQKKQVDSLFDHYRQQISHTTSLLAFYRYLSTILSYIGSLHDDVSLPQPFLDSMVTSISFSYPVSVVNNKLLVNIDDQQIPAGRNVPHRQSFAPNLHHTTPV